MKESPIKTERKTLHLPEDTIRALNKLAARNGTDFSKEVRRAIDEYLDLETTAENIDMINGVIRQELSGQLKALGNRLAGLINRLTIISAAGYYQNGRITEWQSLNTWRGRFPLNCGRGRGWCFKSLSCIVTRRASVFHPSRP